MRRSGTFVACAFVAFCATTGTGVASLRRKSDRFGYAPLRRRQHEPDRSETAARESDREHAYGYFRTGPFTQDLIWEQYAYPVALEALLRGNSPAMTLQPQRATKLAPPKKPRTAVWINKTGSTNGFGSYVAFIPARRCGIVLLANENYSIADRVKIAYVVLTSLCARQARFAESVRR